ncbi:MAG: hypothetical protein KGS10_04140 [Chloroflexi bacterium]|nr:hypothetical protein [Chloroflexota bacterium]
MLSPAKITAKLADLTIGTPLNGWIRSRPVAQVVLAAQRRTSKHLPIEVAAALNGTSRLEIPGFSDASIHPSDRNTSAAALIDAALGEGVSDYLRPFAQQYVDVMVTPEFIEEERKKAIEYGYPRELVYGPEFDEKVEKYREKTLDHGYGFIAAILRKSPKTLTDGVFASHNKIWSKLAKSWLGDNFQAVKATAEREAAVIRADEAAAREDKAAQRKRADAVDAARRATWRLNDKEYTLLDLLKAAVEQGVPIYRTKGGAVDYYARVRLDDTDWFLDFDKKAGAAFRVLYPGHPVVKIGNSRYVFPPEGRYRSGDRVDLGQYRYLPVTGLSTARPEYDTGPVVVLQTSFTRKEYDAYERATGNFATARLAKVAPILGES